MAVKKSVKKAPVKKAPVKRATRYYVVSVNGQTIVSKIDAKGVWAARLSEVLKGNEPAITFNKEYAKGLVDGLRMGTGEFKAVPVSSLKKA